MTACIAPRRTSGLATDSRTPTTTSQGAGMRQRRWRTATKRLCRTPSLLPLSCAVAAQPTHQARRRSHGHRLRANARGKSEELTVACSHTDERSPISEGGFCDGNRGIPMFPQLRGCISADSCLMLEWKRCTTWLTRAQIVVRAPRPQLTSLSRHGSRQHPLGLACPLCARPMCLLDSAPLVRAASHILFVGARNHQWHDEPDGLSKPARLRLAKHSRRALPRETGTEMHKPCAAPRQGPERRCPWRATMASTCRSRRRAHRRSSTRPAWAARVPETPAAQGVQKQVATNIASMCTTSSGRSNCGASMHHQRRSNPSTLGRALTSFD